MTNVHYVELVIRIPRQCRLLVETYSVSGSFRLRFAIFVTCLIDVICSDLLNTYVSQNKRRAHNTLQRDALLYRHVARKIAHDVANAIVGCNS